MAATTEVAVPPATTGSRDELNLAGEFVWGVFWSRCSHLQGERLASFIALLVVDIVCLLLMYFTCPVVVYLLLR